MRDKLIMNFHLKLMFFFIYYYFVHFEEHIDVQVSTCLMVNIFKSSDSRDRLVVRTLRCGRSNPGSNPGHGNVFLTLSRQRFFLLRNIIFLFYLSNIYPIHYIFYFVPFNW